MVVMSSLCTYVLHHGPTLSTRFTESGEGLCHHSV